MSVPPFEINRVVVLLHAGSLSQGSIVPLAFTDVHGEEELMRLVNSHAEAGAKIIYDGPPNVGVKP